MNGNLEQWSGNGWDPLELEIKTHGADNVSFSGNGTGNPTAVMVRQILGSGSLVAGADRVREWVCDVGSFCQEFLKAEFAYKPLITQELIGDDINFYFENDMRLIDYATQSVAGLVTITQEIKGAGLPNDAANAPGSPVVPSSIHFDYATDRQMSTANGGRYIFTAGLGWYDDMDGDRFYAYDPGSYDYADGGVSTLHREQLWSGFYDPGQNSHPGNKAKCDAFNLDVCNLPPINY